MLMMISQGQEKVIMHDIDLWFLYMYMKKVRERAMHEKISLS